MQACPLCTEDNNVIAFRDRLLRVALIEESDLPGFVRVIVNAHVREMTDLDPASRTRVMEAVLAVEQVQREVFAPHKINLASLGNAVPHVHWHVVPRFTDDAFYPQSIWSQRQRETPANVLAARRARVPEFQKRLVEAFARLQ